MIENLQMLCAQFSVRRTVDMWRMLIISTALDKLKFKIYLVNFLTSSSVRALTLTQHPSYTCVRASFKLDFDTYATYKIIPLPREKFSEFSILYLYVSLTTQVVETAYLHFTKTLQIPHGTLIKTYSRILLETS